MRSRQEILRREQAERPVTDPAELWTGCGIHVPGMIRVRQLAVVRRRGCSCCLRLGGRLGLGLRLRLGGAPWFFSEATAGGVSVELGDACPEAPTLGSEGFSELPDVAAGAEARVASLGVVALASLCVVLLAPLSELVDARSGGLSSTTS